ncbi:DJ-1 family glyoxalase III [Zongyangia hominis]|uniref:DJ-1/PfpI family protein n=1 Tax=Zongyangia hominis TaxID=2763677 RepID=A0A926ED17_9FIRM|nr:DJ-1 family glyoxalase III [Zongyangia hominis]MBC8569886.1 DJ-1/PfpI family protein [Zongyangia hominis]
MIYVFLSSGFEETEAIAPIDILRRAELDVQIVGVQDDVVVGSHGIAVGCDTTVAHIDYDNLEMIVLPGGVPGTLGLEKSPGVQQCIDYAVANGLWIGAICAAPSILGHKGLLEGREAICFPGYEQELSGATISGQRVCVDGKFITAKGAGAAVEFGLKLVECLKGEDRAKTVGASMQCW